MIELAMEVAAFLFLAWVGCVALFFIASILSAIGAKRGPR